MKTARNCALILTVFSCASGMRFVADDAYSAHVVANVDRLMGYPQASVLETIVEVEARKTWRNKPMAPWLNVSLDEHQRADPSLVSLDLAMTLPARTIASGFEHHFGGGSFGVTTHIGAISPEI